jgi:N-carbamoylputrescine amidase
MSEARTVRVAAIQVESHNGAIEENLARAAPFVAQAAARGAKLVVCPEFLAAGYIYDESIWKSGEPRMGPTEAWLATRAVEHGIFIGASYLEADGEDFYNTFALAAPDGSISGRVRKQSLPAFEGWYFKSCDGPKVIETALGRIAVGICQDNHTARFMRGLLDDDIDLVLMPHSAPCVPVAGKMMRDSLREVAPFYAEAFGVPVVLVNKVHSRSLSPLPGLPLVRVPFRFPGVSAIVDSDARVLDVLEDAQGFIAADVHIDPARKRRPPAPTDPYWSHAPKQLARALGLMFTAHERHGKRAYARNPRRPRAALAASARTAPATATKPTRKAG